MRSALLLVLAPLALSHAHRWSGWHPGPRFGSETGAQRVVDLNGSGWTLRSQNGSISVPATVPSQQYLDLFSAGVIEDPLYGFNNEQTWVRDQNWTYSRTIGELSAGSHVSRGASTYLVFQGLDTFTTISLCGEQVGTTENQWRQYIFEVSEILNSCRGSPQLSINFGPAGPITQSISTGPDASGNVNFADSCNDDAGHELSCKAYARKEQNDFGWDWSPSLVPAGPWRPIYAVQIKRDQVYINNALIDVYRKGQMNNLPPDQSQPWVFNASIDFVGALPRGSGMHLTLFDMSGHQIMRRQLNGVYSSNDTITGSTIIDSSSVQLWWPNGMGSQPLYNAHVEITSGHGSIAKVERRVGFRTIVLNLNPITEEQLSLGVAPGSNWHFEINGHEFYAKGSNLVPPDVFWPRVDHAKITQLFMLAKDAHMNLLRVWASGAYLDDWIYDMADEMGLLLWSEFEFTDASYPNVPRFIAEYEAEAYYNVRRINHHPSLALWAGGNELEAIQLAFFFGSEIMHDYQVIFEELLIKCVYANTKSISYIPSSTYNGYLSLDFDSVRPQTPRYKNTSGPHYYYADTDTYNYNAATLFDFNSYPTGRFANEFGFISMPSLQSWEQEAPPDQLFYPSDVVINHNRHTASGGSSTTQEAMSLAGIAQMTDAVKMYLPSPNLQDSRANFSAWCYSTQIIHADAMGHQIAYYRRGSGMPERQLGSLYWQLNDLWDAPTWASIEANGRQKMLYYTAKDIFSPVIVYPYWNKTTTDLQVWVTSDLMDSVSGTVSYSWIDWSGRPLSLGSNATNTTAQGFSGHGNAPGHANGDEFGGPSTVSFTIGAINSTEVLHYSSVRSTFSSAGLDMTNALLLLSVTAGSHTHSSVFHPANLAGVGLPDPGLRLAKSGNRFTVTATEAVAAWVWLDYNSNDVKGYWSDNGFWLNKGESKSVEFTVLSDSTGGSWSNGVSVRSVYDNTQS